MGTLVHTERKHPVEAYGSKEQSGSAEDREHHPEDVEEHCAGADRLTWGDGGAGGSLPRPRTTAARPWSSHDGCDRIPELSVRCDPRRVPWLPLAALKEGQRGLWSILVVDAAQGTSVVRPEAVELLYATAEQAFVRGTFKDGADVIRNGTDRVVAGQRVALAKE